MNYFLKLMCSLIFISLIIYSIQPVFASDLLHTFQPISIRDSEYQFHLQVTLRNAGGELISVTESTHGYYIPHIVTNNAFDNHFGEKEIIIINGITYERVQYYETYNLDLPGKLMFFIPAVLQVSSNEQPMIIDANIFQAFVPFVYLDDGDVISTQWTILRILD